MALLKWKRDGNLQKTADEVGLDVLAVVPSDLAKRFKHIKGFPLDTFGIPDGSLVAHGEYNGFPVYMLEWLAAGVSNGESQGLLRKKNKTLRFGAIIVSLPFDAPEMIVRPRTSNGAEQAFGESKSKIIEIDDKEFSWRFRTQSPNKDFVHEVLRPSFRKLLLEGENFSFEWQRDSLCIRSLGRWKYTEYKTALALSCKIASNLPLKYLDIGVDVDLLQRRLIDIALDIV